MVEIGSIVRYTLTEDDAIAVNRRRDNFRAFISTRIRWVTPEPGQPGNDGHMANVGNPVMAGDVFPVVVTRVFNPNGSTNPPVNGQVLLDGNDTHWVSDVLEGEGAGTWSRTEPPAQQSEFLPLSDQVQPLEPALPRIRSLALPDGRFAFVVSGYRPVDVRELRTFLDQITEFGRQCGAVATTVISEHLEVS